MVGKDAEKLLTVGANNSLKSNQNVSSEKNKGKEESVALLKVNWTPPKTDIVEETTTTTDTPAINFSIRTPVSGQICINVDLKNAKVDVNKEKVTTYEITPDDLKRKEKREFYLCLIIVATVCLAVLTLLFVIDLLNGDCGELPTNGTDILPMWNSIL